MVEPFLESLRWAEARETATKKRGEFPGNDFLPCGNSAWALRILSAAPSTALGYEDQSRTISDVQKTGVATDSFQV